MGFKLTQQQIDLIECEVARQPADVQVRYRKMVKNGESPRFALMCAMKSPPRTRYSDKTFNKQRRAYMENMKPRSRNAYLAMAKKAGISTQGKFYVGGLGRPWDPAAWVSTVDDVKKVCQDRNMTADGLVRHQGHSVPPPKKVRLAPDIKKRLVRKYLAEDPALAAKCAKDPSALRHVQEEVVDRHGGPCSA